MAKRKKQNKSSSSPGKPKSYAGSGSGSGSGSSKPSRSRSRQSPSIEHHKRQSLIRRTIRDLESTDTLDHSFRLDIYNYCKKFDRMNPGRLFSILMCGRLLITARCPHGDYSRIIRKTFCQSRYLCMACTENRLKRQSRCWMDNLRRIIYDSNEMLLGPIVYLEWPIPDIRDLKYIRSFPQWIKDVWTPRIESLGAEPGKWFLVTSYDPITKSIRGAYLGANIDTYSTNSPSCFHKDVLLGNNWGSCSGGKRRGGNFSPWLSTEVSRHFLIDDKPRAPVDQSLYIFEQLQKAVDWVVGDAVSIMGVNIGDLYLTEKQYKGRRLFSIHGALNAIRLAQSTPPVDNPVLYIEQKLRGSRGITDLLYIDPRKLVGSVQIVPPGVVDDAGAVKEELCPYHNCPLEDCMEPEDGEYGEGEEGGR